MHLLFQSRGGSIEQFRHVFRKQAKEVLEIYPQAKGKVDPDSDKHHLILKYAPPPIEPITSTPNEPLQSESTPFYYGREIELNPHYEAQVKELCQPVAEFTTEKILFIRRIIIGIKETPYLFIDAKKPDVNVPKSYADEKGYIVLSITGVIRFDLTMGLIIKLLAFQSLHLAFSQDNAVIVGNTIRCLIKHNTRIFLLTQPS